ncbi:Mu-like prophage tail sheath protein gpL [Snodgrassella sp. R-53583]|nr:MULTISPECIES: phage tail sheath subtilisin-like domain-containing protein [Snodgrassella]SCB72008.1 Mu-like prophage tail sheath protein gpL [Snodgrassella sp. R-53583]
MIDNIQFDTVRNDIRVPGRYIEFNTRTAVRGLPANPQKMLLIAPMLPEGKQPALTPVQLFSDADAATLFGHGSWAYHCVKQAFVNNPYLDLTIIGVNDVGQSTAATASVSVVFANSLNNSGILTITIGGIDCQITVSSNDDTLNIIDRMVDIINSANTLAVAEADGYTIKLTARNSGSIGNEIALLASFSAENVSLADVSLDIKPFQGGYGDQDIGPALEQVAGKHYHIICNAFTDSLNARKLSDHIDLVSNAIEKRGCIGVMGWRGTLSTGTAFAKDINSGRITIAWYKNAMEGNAIIAAGYAAVIAGETDPARPLNTLEIKGLRKTTDANWPLFAEFNSALYNGLTPLQIVNNRVQIMRAVSTYVKNATGTDDPALLDITTIRTLDYVRDAVNQRIALRFPREKLSERTPLKVRSEILDVLYQCENAEILEAVLENKDKLIVQRNPNDPNRLDAVIPADVVNGLHVLAARVDLYL